MIPYLSEIVPPLVKTAGFSLAYSLATALFGGVTPLVSTYLIQTTQNRAVPALWLSAAAIISLAAVLASRRFAPISGVAQPIGARRPALGRSTAA